MMLLFAVGGVFLLGAVALETQDEKLAECKCVKGKCELKDGNTVCVCPPEFGLLTSSFCKACECGKGANCTFESTGWFSTKTICICPKDYREVNEKCLIQVVSVGVSKFNRDQKKVCDDVLNSVDSNSGQLFFLNAPGGTGKTFLINLLLVNVRSGKNFAIAVV
ncbi:fibropellin-1 [Nephila pilipes]|uniref:ATP-dependent DNA helicase n=1 Tax=Nephila pilipes TaxID=299642 RepID=A0A8X6TYU3_NEPPI|nr:fibropellin-1 [Nephila pilipes]